MNDYGAHWSPAHSPINRINIIARAYLLLVAALALAFLLDGVALALYLVVVLILLLISRIPLVSSLRRTWKILGALAVSALLLGSLSEGLALTSLELAGKFFLRILAVFVVGGLFILSTDPAEGVFLGFKYRAVHPLGIGLGAAVSGLLALPERMVMTLSLHRLRGAILSRNPTSWMRHGLDIVGPLIIYAADLAAEYSNSLTIRGFQDDRALTTPGYLAWSMMDFMIVLMVTIVLISYRVGQPLG